MHIATILSAAALISSTAFANPDELDKKEAEPDWRPWNHRQRKPVGDAVSTTALPTSTAEDDGCPINTVTSTITWVTSLTSTTYISSTWASSLTSSNSSSTGLSSTASNPGVTASTTSHRDHHHRHPSSSALESANQTLTTSTSSKTRRQHHTKPVKDESSSSATAYSSFPSSLTSSTTSKGHHHHTKPSKADASSSSTAVSTLSSSLTTSTTNTPKGHHHPTKPSHPEASSSWSTIISSPIPSPTPSKIHSHHNHPTASTSTLSTLTSSHYTLTATPISIASGTDLHPSTSCIMTTTVTGTPPTGTAVNPKALHCGLHGLPVGDYFLASFVQENEAVPLTVLTCWKYCTGIYGIDMGCESYEFYPELYTEAPRCDLFGGSVAQSLDSVDPYVPNVWFDLGCGMPGVGA